MNIEELFDDFAKQSAPKLMARMLVGVNRRCGLAGLPATSGLPRSVIGAKGNH